jgi:hypothetical protein
MKYTLALLLALSTLAYAGPKKEEAKKEPPAKLEVKVKKPCKPGQTEADGCRVLKKQK